MLSKTAGGIKTNYTYNAANQLVGDGTYKYTYADVIIEKGTVLYRGELGGTGYFTTLDAVEASGRNATTLFEGLQVKPYDTFGYRGEMEGYVLNENVSAAYGIVKANPQFGEGGLPQYYIPNVEELIDNGVLIAKDNIKLLK